MTVETIRRLWFLGFWLLLPWPMWVTGDAFVPAVRYVLLAAAAGAVALTEGADGPVAMIVTVLVVWALSTTLLCWLFSRLVTRILVWGAPRAAFGVTCTTFALALLLSLFTEPYRTVFGRALRGGLLEILS